MWGEFRGVRRETGVGMCYMTEVLFSIKKKYSGGEFLL